MLKEKLKNTCSFRRVWEEKGEERYPQCELCYVRAYHDGNQWWKSSSATPARKKVPTMMSLPAITRFGS